MIHLLIEIPNVIIEEIKNRGKEIIGKRGGGEQKKRENERRGKKKEG